MKSLKNLSFLFAVAAMQIALLVAPAESQFYTGSRLLLSYFEVDLERGETRTLFAVTNTAAQPVEVRASVYSNWGIEVLETTFELGGHEVLTTDLHRWLGDGVLPDRTLSSEELEHVQASLSGQRSPSTDMFYSKEIVSRQAVGYIIFSQIGGAARPDALMGDFFNLATAEDYAQGQALLNIDPASSCEKICFRHGLRFLSGGFDAGTEIFIWTRRHGSPSVNGHYPDGNKVETEFRVYAEDGELIDVIVLGLLPLEVLRIGELGLPIEFGWIDIVTEDESFIAVRYGALGRFSVGLKTFCIPLEEDPPPQIRIEKRTNGIDADQPPGPSIPVGQPVTWTYFVSNVGGVPLTGVTVTDSEGVFVSCPKDALEPLESMTCTGEGIAEECQYSNLGTALGTAPDGTVVRDDDRSHYFGVGEISAAVDIEKSTNGKDADTVADAPFINDGDDVRWEYIVTNTGSVRLENIAVADDREGAVSCPRTSLDPGETMTCRKSGVGTAGEGGTYSNRGTVTATGVGDCGEVEVTDFDDSHYKGPPDEICDPCIDIEKYTIDADGQAHDADFPAQRPDIPFGSTVRWDYVVTNLSSFSEMTIESVTDNRVANVICPQQTLAPLASMTCVASDLAVCGAYQNLATAKGRLAGSAQTLHTDTDRSHYFGTGCVPDIDIEKYTIDSSGFAHDADQPTGPTIDYGDPVTWEYVITNTGNVTLTDVRINDNRLPLPVCTGLTLDPGQSATCTATGTAGCGQYSNRGHVLGLSPAGTWVDDLDSSHYLGRCDPKIDIEKFTRDPSGGLHNADTAPGPAIPYLEDVEWVYEVTNTGDVDFVHVSVIDDREGPISCPQSTLAVGESMTCTAAGISDACFQYENEGTATGRYINAIGEYKNVTDSDLSHYICNCDAGISIEKATNGVDADSAPGPSVPQGDTVTWSYVVKNIGEVPLQGISVTDDREGPISCPQSTLAAGEEMTCDVAVGTATCGQYVNVGTVSGYLIAANDVLVDVGDSDFSHYFGDCP